MAIRSGSYFVGIAANALVTRKIRRAPTAPIMMTTLIMNLLSFSFKPRHEVQNWILSFYNTGFEEILNFWQVVFTCG